MAERQGRVRRRKPSRQTGADFKTGVRAQAKADRRTRRTRRRFVRRQWRRRWLTWRPLLLVIGALLVAAAGVWVVWFSSVLAVKAVVVTGTATLSQREVRTAAEVTLGDPMVSVRLGGVHDRVAALAPVASVKVSRRWPDQVVVAVTERTPIAVIDIGGTLRGLDKDGVVFRHYKKVPANLPKVVTPTGTSASALREAARVVSSLPPDLARITDHVEVASVDEISLALTEGRTVTWGSSADSAQKAQVLTVLLKHPATVYDVSVPGQPTTK